MMLLLLLIVAYEELSRSLSARMVFLMTSPAPWYKRHRTLFLLGTFLLVQAIVWPLLPGTAASWQRNDGQLLEFKAEQLTAITRNPTDNSLRTSTKSGTITWPATLCSGVLHVQLQMQELTEHRPIILQYITAGMPYFDDDVIHSKSIRPAIERESSQTTMTWHLPHDATSFRLLIAPDCRFEIRHIQLAGLNPDEAWWHLCRQVLAVLCLAVSFSLFLHWLSQYLRLLSGWYRSPAAISLTWLAVQGVVMIWLLPPFQGPDENRHWKTAVEFFRRDGQEGSALYRLPVLLDAESPRWRSEIPYRPNNALSALEESRPRAETVKVTYTKHWGYPTVGLVSLLFPPVATLNEALLFFYACRLVNLACLLVLVAYAWKLGVGSWTLVTFLSFPLVLQQCVIVSTDTVHNLGTFWAVLLFCRQRQQGSTWNWWLLLLVSFLVVAAKPPIYLMILFLPAWFLPWQQLRQARYWVPALLGGVALLAVGIWYLWYIVDGSGMQLGNEARAQLQYVLTGSGLTQFIQAAMDYPYRFLNPESWFRPLGWLDTNLSGLHMALLWLSFWIAVMLDIGTLFSRLKVTGVQPLLGALPVIAGSAVSGIFVWWSLALVMYLTISGYQSTGIVGMQVRYMVPVIFLFLLWPIACVSQATIPAKTSGLVCWAGCLLCIIALVRAGLLALDLQLRYWG